MAQNYCQPGLTLAMGTTADPALVRMVQQDLRRLGYLGTGIDGRFGRNTERAIKALQFDLLNNHGQSRQKDGGAPVAITDYNKGRVMKVSGILNQSTAACMVDLIRDDKVPKLPNAADPAAENRRAMAAIATATNGTVPAPFLKAILMQESGGRHFVVPQGTDEDNYITIGLDRADGGDAITSRGYGVGQSTLFHHPPRFEEIHTIILDPVGNVAKACRDLRLKFDQFILGPASKADDRLAEHRQAPLRLCKYGSDDPRFMRDCGNCAMAARRITIEQGMPFHAGAASSYQPSQYHAAVTYKGVPDRADFPCDWPYAVRRYNGGGVNSYHYQARIMLKLLEPAVAGD
ncbi:MAG TPA: peptidoglycan-binding domain-containing protein [Dongiaceae bacterium]|jgi:hypothetical protein|nr:peptidoglycan-binding domain-containing protein [Dongiaceae bacterium]